MERQRFGAADYAVFSGTILVSLSIGVYHAVWGRGRVSNSEYLTGGGDMGLLPVTVSLLVTFLSTIGVLGNSAEVYAYGTQYMMFLLALVPGIVCGTYLFVPLYYPLRITSVFEYYRMRFRARYLELTCAGISVIMLILLNGILIFAPCVAFQAVSGFPVWASIAICGVTASVYTTVGGMKAVVWTDVFQAVVILAGLLAVVIKGTFDVGGVQEVWRLNQEWGRVKFFDFSFDPTVRMTFWSVAVADSVLWACMLSAQASLQRFNALSSMEKARKATLLMIPGFVAFGFLTCMCGVIAFAFYAKKGCDPITSGQLSPTQILPFFVMDVLNVPCLPGLFIAAIFSATLSSISSNYNALAAVTWGDLLQHRLSHLPGEAQTRVNKLTTLVYGLLSTAAAFTMMHTGGTLVQLAYSVMSVLSGPLMGVGILGGLCTRPGARSTLAAIVTAVSFSAWLTFGAQLRGKHTPMLPGPTHGCYLHGNDTGAVVTGGIVTYVVDTDLTVTEFSVPLDYRTVNTSHINTIDIEDSSQSGLEWFYSISYFYYHPLAITIVLVSANLFSLIPGFENDDRPVPKKLLFTFLRRWFGAANNTRPLSHMCDTPSGVDEKCTASTTTDTEL